MTADQPGYPDQPETPERRGGADQQAMPGAGGAVPQPATFGPAQGGPAPWPGQAEPGYIPPGPPEPGYISPGQQEPGYTAPGAGGADPWYTPQGQAAMGQAQQQSGQGPADPAQAGGTAYGQGGYGQQAGYGYGPQPGQYGQPQYGQYGQYGQQYAAYGQQGWYGPSRPTNSLAIASLVLSIIGLILVPILAGVPAIILGAISLRQISERGEQGRGLAISGLVIGIIGVLFWGLLILVLVAAAHSVGS